jgi:hypothetical protein
MDAHRGDLTDPEWTALFDKVTSGAADGILYIDTNKAYKAQDPNWKYEPAVANQTPNVLGFMDWFRTAHPDDHIDGTSTRDQVRPGMMVDGVLMWQLAQSVGDRIHLPLQVP